MKLLLLRYWLAMNATAFDSAMHSVATFCGVAGAHEALGTVPALNLPQLALVFVVMFARAILKYQDAHPVSELLPAPTRPATNNPTAPL